MFIYDSVGSKKKISRFLVILPINLFQKKQLINQINACPASFGVVECEIPSSQSPLWTDINIKSTGSCLWYVASSELEKVCMEMMQGQMLEDGEMSLSPPSS